jgi:predicted alpha/beta-fold hydrolase
MVTAHGGHCGFVSDPTDGSDGYWAETQIVDFAERVTAGVAEPASR